MGRGYLVAVAESCRPCNYHPDPITAIRYPSPLYFAKKIINGSCKTCRCDCGITCAVSDNSLFSCILCCPDSDVVVEL